MRSKERWWQHRPSHILLTFALSIAGVWYAREQVRLARIQVTRTERATDGAAARNPVSNLEKTQLEERESRALRDAGFSTPPSPQETTDSLKELVRELRKSVEAEPKNFLLRLQLAAHILRLGEVSEAESIIRAAAQDHPNDARPPTVLARVLLEHRDPQGARNAAQDALTIDPRLAPAHALLGVALDRLGFERSALTALRYAVALDPTTAIAHQRVGFIALRSLDYTQAEISFTNALELDHSVTNVLALGATFVSEGRREDARAALNAARTLAPSRFMTMEKDYKPDFAAALASMSPDLDELSGRFLLNTRELQPNGSLDGFQIVLIRALLGTRDRILFGQLENALMDLCVIPDFVDASPLCGGLLSFGRRHSNCPDMKADMLVMMRQEVALPASEIPCEPE